MFENWSVFVRIGSGDQTRYPKESPGKHPYFELRDSSQKTKKSHTCFNEMEEADGGHVLAEMRIQKNIPDPHVSTFIFRARFFWTTFAIYQLPGFEHVGDHHMSAVRWGKSCTTNLRVKKCTTLHLWRCSKC